MNKFAESTLGKYKKYLKVKNYSDRTIDMYIYYVKEMLEYFNKPALHISSKEINEYILNYSYSSISKQNGIYSSIKLFSKCILEFKNINKIVPERPRKEKRLPQIIDKEYLLKKINNISNLKHQSILSLGYSVGLRVSEVCNLKLTDIDSNRMVIVIRQSKGRKDRIVPLTDKILELLRDYYKRYKPKEYLFNGQNSLQYAPSSCNKLVKKYLGEQYHFHLLRHAAFTHLTDQGVDIRAIQKLAGHKSSKTTEIYTQVSTQVLHKLPLAL